MDTNATSTDAAPTTDPITAPPTGHCAIRVIPTSQYKRMRWKNGLGTTDEICVDPPHVDFRTEPFLWRLSSAQVQASCSWSVFSHCQTYIVLLPQPKVLGDPSSTPTVGVGQPVPRMRQPSAMSTLSTTSSTASTAIPQLKIRHNDGAKVHVVKPLMPYTYDAGWTTQCEINMPCQDLTLITNKQKVKAEVTVETLDTDSCFQTLLLAPTTILVCVEGSLRVECESDTCSRSSVHAVRCGETLLLQRDEHATPRHLKVHLFKSAEAASETSADCNKNTSVELEVDANPDVSQEAIFVLYQIFERSLTSKETAYATARTPSVQLHGTAVPGHVQIPQPSSSEGWKQNGPPTSSGMMERKGSMLIYDDQPLWALPQDMADRLNIQQQQQQQQVSAPQSPAFVAQGGGILPTGAMPALTMPASGLVSPMSPGMVKSPLHYFPPSQIYAPPEWSFAHIQEESDVPEAHVCDHLNLDEFPEGRISCVWINMIKQGLSEWIRIPCIVARGLTEPDAVVLGITAALHGNEVNGVSCIQRVMADLDVSKLRGTVVAIPCVNIPGYLNFQREFSDGKDLNRLFPGRMDGTASQIYAFNVMEKIVCNFHYLIDLHTASFGRVNSYYVRADMNDPITRTLALLQQPQIALHNSGQDGTMRSAASQRGIKSITVEIGNPQQFQNQFIQWSYQGLMNILHHLEMYASKDMDGDSAANGTNGSYFPQTETKTAPPPPPVVVAPPILATPSSFDPKRATDIQPHPMVICSKGFWTYTRTGGVLEVYPVVNAFVKKGLVVARIRNIFGNVIDEYFAPCDAMVIGRSSNPVAQAGDRIIHFGVPLRKGEQLPLVAKENY